MNKYYIGAIVLAVLGLIGIIVVVVEMHGGGGSHPHPHPPQNWECKSGTCKQTACTPVSDTCFAKQQACSSKCTPTSQNWECKSGTCKQTACTPVSDTCFAKQQACSSKCTPTSQNWECKSGTCKQTACTPVSDTCFAESSQCTPTCQAPLPGCPKSPNPVWDSSLSKASNYCNTQTPGYLYDLKNKGCGNKNNYLSSGSNSCLPGTLSPASVGGPEYCNKLGDWYWCKGAADQKYNYDNISNTCKPSSSGSFALDDCITHWITHWNQPFKLVTKSSKGNVCMGHVTGHQDPVETLGILPAQMTNLADCDGWFLSPEGEIYHDKFTITPKSGASRTGRVCIEKIPSGTKGKLVTVTENSDDCMIFERNDTKYKCVDKNHIWGTLVPDTSGTIQPRVRNKPDGFYFMGVDEEPSRFYIQDICSDIMAGPYNFNEWDGK